MTDNLIPNANVATNGTPASCYSEAEKKAAREQFGGAGRVTPIDEALWERRLRALTMRNAGATFQRIADQMGLSAATVRNDVRMALREVVSETAEDMVARQRSILLDMTRSLYPNALQGDLDAQKQIIRILDHEAKLFGLYAPTRVNVGVSDTEFAEQAAELIAQLGLEPPRELMRGVRRPEAIPGEVLDVETAEIGQGGAVPPVTEAQRAGGGDTDSGPWSNL